MCIISMPFSTAGSLQGHHPASGITSGSVLSSTDAEATATARIIFILTRLSLSLAASLAALPRLHDADNKVGPYIQHGDPLLSASGERRGRERERLGLVFDAR
jgi:hypothetical protein